jgi:hypothetical protein
VRKVVAGAIGVPDSDSPMAQWQFATGVPLM